MKLSHAMLAAASSLLLFAGGCAKEKSPLDKAVDGTKDALNIRDHEKLKDAGEDVQPEMSRAPRRMPPAASRMPRKTRPTTSRTPPRRTTSVKIGPRRNFATAEPFR